MLLLRRTAVDVGIWHLRMCGVSQNVVKSTLHDTDSLVAADRVHLLRPLYTNTAAVLETSTLASRPRRWPAQ